jgi:deoxyribodipyrimidine photo-lyase
MSPYLHFGQISPLHLLLMLDEHMGRKSKNSKSFVEELAVRRTLCQNFCLHEPDYDKFSCLPDWALQTLEEHKDDEREHVYTREQLEQAETHDPYWNAAQKEMVLTGYMHNHMRMYWGKQILAWTNTPQYAHSTALYLNNKYLLDGRDPDSFANIAWLFGLHDQGWKERPVFGKVRIMTQGGLKRKCDPDEYVKWVDRKTGA